jgi:hypothetical protein
MANLYGLYQRSGTKKWYLPVIVDVLGKKFRLRATRKQEKEWRKPRDISAANRKEAIDTIGRELR